MTTYRIVYDVESSQTLTTIMGLLGEVPGVKLVTVHDAANQALPPSPLPPANAGHRYVSGRKVKAVKGNDLIVDLLQNGPADLDEIKRTFVADSGGSRPSFRDDAAHQFRDDLAHRSEMMSPTIPG